MWIMLGMNRECQISIWVMMSIVLNINMDNILEGMGLQMYILAR